MANKIINSFAWSAVDKFSNLAVQFLLGVIIARLITPEEYGVLGILMVFINISQVFIESGLGSALIYKNKIDNGYLCTSFVFNLVVSTILFLILFLFAPFIEFFFDLSGLSDYIRVSSLVLITNSMIIVPTSILKIQLNFRSLAVSNIISTIISGILGIVIAYFGFGVWALIAQLMSKSLLLFLLLYITCHWTPKLCFNKIIFKELYRYGINIFSASCLTKVVDECTSFFIGKFLNPYSLGVYARGRQFSSLPGNSIGGVITTALFPSLSSIRNDESRFLDVYHKVLEIQALLCIPAFVWLAVVADPLVRILITEKWIDVVPVIQILCLGQLLLPAAYITEQVLNAKGRSDLFLRQQIWKMIIKSIIILGCLPFGLTYVVIGEAIYITSQFFITNLCAREVSDFTALAQLKVIIPYIICALVSGALTYWAIVIYYFNQLLCQIIFGTILLVGVYLIILYIICGKGPIIRLVFQMMRKRVF